MDKLVSINHTKENILKFNLSIEGIKSSDIVAKFVIHGKDMELGFCCKHKAGDEWTVTIPALPVLERTAYPFHFDLFTDGYHFEPLRGTLNVVGGNEIYISAPKNAKIAPEVTPKEEKIEVVETVVNKDEIVRKVLGELGINKSKARFSLKN